MCSDALSMWICFQNKSSDYDFVLNPLLCPNAIMRALLQKRKFKKAKSGRKWDQK